VLRLLKTAVREMWGGLLEVGAEDRILNPRDGAPHNLPGELIVSLTSYPPRFATLRFTLGTLLDQTVKPDRIILWIASADMAGLPEIPDGVEVRECDDCRSFKKLVPALEAFPDAFMVTADDDVCYPPNWLETLLAANDGSSIVCNHARRVSGRPYHEWPSRVVAPAPSSDLMPTGIGGVLYPPRSLHSMVTDRSAFMSLCPTGDDLWFYACARRAGTKVRTISKPLRLIPWRGSQKVALFDDNEAGENDKMLANLAPITNSGSCGSTPYSPPSGRASVASPCAR
jgi:hypothetical protein